MSKTVRVLGIVVGVLVTSQVAQADELRQRGYFKGANSDRVFTVEISPDVMPEAAQAHGARLPYTPGQMTAAYYYVRGSMIPVDGVTRAKNLFEVNRVLYDVPGLSPWTFAYQRSRNGEAVFVDCRNGAVDLCR